MPGHGCPRGPFCLLQNNLAPAQRLRRMAVHAQTATMVLVAFLLQVSNSPGQQSQINNDLFRIESMQREGGGARIGSLIIRRGTAKRTQRKKQSQLNWARRRLIALERSESDEGIQHPRLAEVIKSRDFPRLAEDDWQAMVFERDTLGLFQPFGHIPDRQFNDVPHVTYANLDSLPLAVRQSQTDQQLYFYLANASPWRLRVRMQFPENASEEAIKGIKSLSQDKFDLVSNTTDNGVLTVDLGPYDLIGGATLTFGPIESYSFEYLDDVASDMRKRVFALQVKLQQAQQTGALRMLSNPEFLAGDPSESNPRPIPGWEIGQQPPSRFQLLRNAVKQKTISNQNVARQADEPSDLDEKLMETYLQIRSSADEVTWIRSQPVTPTETGRLSISVWLRVLGDASEKTDRIPEVRMAIDGQAPTGDYYRFGAVGDKPVGSESEDSLISLGAKWKRFALRIGFDVVGEGAVEIGQVELYDRWFDNGDAKRITQLLASADAMLRQPAQFDRCRRLLEEPWAVFLDDHFLLKPMPRSAQQPVPMFRPKVTEATAAKQKNGKPKKAGESLKR